MRREGSWAVVWRTGPSRLEQALEGSGRKGGDLAFECREVALRPPKACAAQAGVFKRLTFPTQEGRLRLERGRQAATPALVTAFLGPSASRRPLLDAARADG